jgi:hypothetical protein
MLNATPSVSGGAMQTRSAPMILLLMLSFFETTSRGIDPFDRLKFTLGDGYQVIA